MKSLAKLLIAVVGLGATPANALSAFQHIVIVVQENRTPDNLFYGLCASSGGTLCSTTDPNKYDIQTSGWLTTHGPVNPSGDNLGAQNDPPHLHANWLAQCNPTNTAPPPTDCRMNGPATLTYVYTQGQGQDYDLSSYFNMATSYGWANKMFQTNQGPSFPAHQFLFGATSAPSYPDDQAGTYASKNASNGCVASKPSRVQLINPLGIENPNNTVFPCFEHTTVSDLLNSASVAWRYYTPAPPGQYSTIWNAPEAIEHICGTNNSKNVNAVDHCPGLAFMSPDPNVVENPNMFLSDATSHGGCKLAPVSWVIPDGTNSDHAGLPPNFGGPSWVTSIVDTIGESTCTNPDGSSYWDTTAVVVTWDDWGGWYDHEPPTLLPNPFGGYQLGFRVPLIFISAYTPAGYISNNRLDFGSIARFIENNFGITEGSLNMADQRAAYDLSEFYNFNNAPRAFAHINARHDPHWFLTHNAPPTPPDDD